MSQVPEKIPLHVAIIMDGNGRWAKERNLPRLVGHRQGVDNLRRVLEACGEFGVKYLTIFAFSTENWERPEVEVRGLINILEDVIDTELEEMNERGVQLRHLGRLDGLSEGLQAKVHKAVELTKNNDRLHLSIAWNYGGRDEIVQAVEKIVAADYGAEDITEDLISRHLYTSDIPDPDLIIRTSGEQRVSNFLIWQGAYAEWVVTPKFWPDFGREELLEALIDYAERERRFGRVSGPVSQY